jgi:hypothetical protein
VTSLPFIDAYEVAVNAPPEAAWDAVAAVLPRIGGRAGPAFARLLGCAEPDADFPRAIVGFRVARLERPAVISLQGEHRFSSYSLWFLVEPGPESTILRAETRALFPGPAGRVYRALVIGTGGHIVIVRRMLTAIKRRAERA